MVLPSTYLVVLGRYSMIFVPDLYFFNVFPKSASTLIPTSIIRLSTQLGQDLVKSAATGYLVASQVCCPSLVSPCRRSNDCLGILHQVTYKIV